MKLKFMETKTTDRDNSLKNYNINSRFYAQKISNVFFGGNYVIQPFFQRNFVWDNQKKCDFIESIILGLPIPTIYTYKVCLEENEIVIDGQQRLTTIRDFLNNKFKLDKLNVCPQFNSYFYKDLPGEIKNKIYDYTLNFVCLENVNNERIIFDIFKRFNTGGIALNNQEIRRCIYNSSYTELITKLSNYPDFVKQFNFNQINRLETEEYVLRFLALYQNFENYNGNMNQFLDNYLNSKLQTNNKEEIQKLKKTFVDTVDACFIVFGENAFKNCLTLQTSNGTKTVMYKLISKSVFDLQMLGFAGFELELINRYSKKIKNKYEEVVLNDEKIRPYYKKMSRRAIEYRVTKWREIIKDIIKY